MTSRGTACIAAIWRSAGARRPALAADRHRRHPSSTRPSTVPSHHEYIGPMTSEAGGAMPSRRLELVPADELKAALADGVRAQHEAGDLQASRDSFERAYRLAERAGDVESMALAALGLAGLWVAERRTVTSTVLLEARLQHVLTLLDPRSAL